MTEKLRIARGVIRRGSNPRVPEKAEQAHIVQLVRSIGGHVYVLGTHRRSTDFQGTMQTHGVPDLICFIPDKRRSIDPPEGTSFHFCVFIECKAVGGRLRPEQRQFRELALKAEVTHLVGGLDVVIQFLVDKGLAKSEQFPHYRQPAAPRPQETV